jgi:hypothetical protein
VGLLSALFLECSGLPYALVVVRPVFAGLAGEGYKRPSSDGADYVTEFAKQIV